MANYLYPETNEPVGENSAPETKPSRRPGAFFWITAAVSAFVLVSLFLVVFGFVKSAQFKKTEKTAVTFYKPISYVSSGTRDDDGEYEYTITVKYEYGGREREYRFTERTSTSHSSYKVGQMIRFTRHFTPDGNEITDGGKTMRFVGFILLAISGFLLFTVMKLHFGNKKKPAKQKK